MSQILTHIQVALLVLFLLFGAGGCLTLASNQKVDRFFWSYSYSLLLLVSTQAFISVVSPDISLAEVCLSYVGIFLFALSIGLLIRKRRKFRKFDPVHLSLHNAATVYWGPVFVSILFLTYHSLVGPYTEIPTDFWKHIARITGFEIDTNSLFKSSPILSASGSAYWYRTVAIMGLLLELTSLETAPMITGITGLLFLLSTYFFSIKVLVGLDLSPNQRIAIALLATFLTFLYLGTATFSYVRYYALAPAIVAFPLVYFAILIAQNSPNESRGSGIYLRILGLTGLFCLAYLVHVQEAFFIIVIASLILARKGLKRIIRSWPFRGFHPITAAAAVVGIPFTALFLISRTLIYWLDPTFDWNPTPHLSDAGTYISTLAGLPIANPTFRIWDTVGIFGIAVLGLAILRWREISGVDYFVAALLIPFFTFFNPLFVALFLYLADPSVAWRPAYLLPFPLICSYLVVLSFGSTLRRKLLVTGVTVGLIYATNSESVLRLFGDNLTRVSRVSSILSTDVRSGASAWADIIQGFREYNTRYPVNRIISDPITRFVLSASVFGQITMYVDGHYFPRLNNEYIKDFETSDHSRDLLIINERGVAETGNSRLARHWPPELTNTRKHYPASLRYYLQSNEDQYTNVWKSSGIDFFSFPPFGR